MTLPRILAIAFGGVVAFPLIADISAPPKVASPPFQVVAVPDVPEIGAPAGFLLLSAADTVPTGINNNGQIVGTYLNLPYPDVQGAGPFGTFGFFEANGSYGAFFAGEASGAFCYSGGSCGNELYPTGINDSGTVVGNYVGDQFGGIDGFVTQGLYTCSTCQTIGISVASIVYPGVQPGYGETNVTGVNDSGAIVGNYNYYDGLGDQFAGGFLFNGGVFTPLSFSPIGINNLGQILGLDSAGETLIDANGKIQDLGVLPFAPTGFNDNGFIVGGDYLYYYPSGSLTQVNLQGESSVQINGINDLEQFVGTANGSNGQIGFEVATPEPYEGIPLMGGLCAIALLRFRARGRKGS